MATRIDRFRCAEVFAKFDIEGDGRLDTRELNAALDYLGLPAPCTAVEDLLRGFDVDDSGRIEFDEFVALVADVDKRTERQ
jgi:Ca2+-binding EF-hand superfamily protein